MKKRSKNRRRSWIVLMGLLFLIPFLTWGCASQPKPRDQQPQPQPQIQPNTPVPISPPLSKPPQSPHPGSTQEQKATLPEELEPPHPDSLILLKPEEIPLLLDDLPTDSLLAAIDKSLLFYSRVPAEIRYPMGPIFCTAEELRETLLLFRKILKNSSSEEEKKRIIAASFDFYQSAGRDQKGTVLFTGYFEPIFKGSLQKEEAYPFPLYQPPEETVVINLGKFKRKYEGESLTGRLLNGEVVPHYTREEIDGQGILSGRNLEIGWAADSIDLFFLHIQGSGIMVLPDGRNVRVGYARSNGHPFRGLAKVLLERGKITERDMTHEAVKSYLQNHPEERAELMQQNPSYVFFRILDGENVGSHNVPLTAGRSIATDPKYFPKGALALIRLRKPVFSGNGSGTGWVPFSRFVLNQDAGGAIKGTGRVDLFCGTGQDAEKVAGSIKEQGTLFFLLKKKGISGNGAATVF